MDREFGLHHAYPEILKQNTLIQTGSSQYILGLIILFTYLGSWLYWKGMKRFDWSVRKFLNSPMQTSYGKLKQYDYTVQELDVIIDIHKWIYNEETKKLLADPDDSKKPYITEEVDEVQFNFPNPKPKRKKGTLQALRKSRKAKHNRAVLYTLPRQRKSGTGNGALATLNMESIKVPS